MENTNQNAIISDSYLLEPGALNMAYALDRYPLFDYADENGEIHVAFYCLADNTEKLFPLLATVIWCGQMSRFSLHIHVVSDTAEDIRAALISAMPALCGYSDLDPSKKNRYTYVSFDFVTAPDLALAARSARRKNAEADKAAQQICSGINSCWMAVLMGDRSADLALRCLSAGDASAEKAVLLECSSKAVNAELLSALKQQCRLHFLSDETSAYRGFCARLEERALRTHLVYVGNGHTRNNVIDFHTDAVSRCSSAAFALHIPYKLCDIGIGVSSRPGTIAREYIRKVLPDSDSPEYDSQCRNFEELAALEHRRWLMYCAVTGWKPASISSCREYCFERESILSKPCFKFKIAELKLHPAMVPGTAVRPLAEWTDSMWDMPRTDNDIAALELDPLDKVSLRLHLLAGEKMAKDEPVRRRHLDSLRRLTDGNTAAAKVYDRFSDWYLKEGCNAHTMRTEDDWFARVRETFDSCGIDRERTAAALTALKNDLRVVNEYYSRNDYKDSDVAPIEQLAYIYLKPDKLTLISIAADGMLDNIAAPMMIAPDRLVMYGLSEEDGSSMRQVLDNYVHINSFECVPPDEDCSFAAVLRRLRSRLKRELESLGRGGLCLIDVTGAPEELISAVWRLRGESRELGAIGVVTADSKNQRIINLAGFDIGEACRPHLSISVKDMMSLYQATPSGGDESELARWNLMTMKDDFMRVWDFSRTDTHYNEFFDLMNDNLATGFSVCSWGMRSVSFNIKLETFRSADIPGLIQKISSDCPGLTMEQRLNPDNSVQLDIRCPMPLIPVLSGLIRRAEELVYASHEYASDSGFCCISLPKPQAEVITSWEMGGKSIAESREYTLNAQRYVNLCIERLLDMLMADKVIAHYSKNMNKVRISARKCVHAALDKLARYINGSDAAMPEYDAAGSRIIAKSSLPEAADIPCPQLVPEGYMPFIYWERLPDGETTLSWDIPREIFLRAQLRKVLNAMVAHEKEGFSWNYTDDITDPELSVLTCTGPAQVIRALNSLMSQLKTSPLADLVYSPNTNSIAPANGTLFRAKIMKNSQRTALEKAKAAGVIGKLTYTMDDHAVFELPSRSFAGIFEKAGNLLEYYTWYEAYNAGFDDVQNGYMFNWGAPGPNGKRVTKNELDVLATKGLQLMLISCKATRIYSFDDAGGDENAKCKYNMYEIRLLANQFSRDTKAVLLYLSSDTLSEALAYRAKSINTSVLVLNGRSADPTLSDGRRLRDALTDILNT